MTTPHTEIRLGTSAKPKPYSSRGGSSELQPDKVGRRPVKDYECDWEEVQSVERLTTRWNCPNRSFLASVATESPDDFLLIKEID